MKKATCPRCGKEISFIIGDFWVNNSGYQVQILDYGINDVWLLYLENKNKAAFEIEKFIKEYRRLGGMS